MTAANLRLEAVPYLLDLGCTFGQLMSISILSGDNWYPAIIGSKAVIFSR